MFGGWEVWVHRDAVPRNEVVLDKYIDSILVNLRIQRG